MRKLVAVILSVSMVLGFAACGKKDDNNVTGGEVTLTPAGTEEEAAVILPDAAENTVGSILWEAFLSTKKENPEAGALDIANVLYQNSVITYAAGASEVQPGWLSGFSEDITGFESAATFGPMMGSIAFIGYVFDLAEDADVAAFVKNLKDKSNPRWNVCVEADYVQAGAYENTVYFLMYPEDLNQNLGLNSGNVAEPSEAVVISPEVAEDTWGATLWASFAEIMAEDPSASAVDVAFALSMDESITFMSGAAEVLPGLLAGFSTEITEFKNGAKYMPMTSSEAFVGYVFELEDGADVEAFLSTLKENSDPAWNICVIADQTVAGAYNNMVFFLMCPNSNQG